MRQAASGPAKATVPSTEYSVLSTQSLAQNKPASGKSKSSRIRGRVVESNGKPVANLHIAIIGFRIRPEQGGDLSSESDVLAESASDDNGRFEIQLSGISAKSHSLAHVIARSDDSGIAWRRIDPDEREIDVALAVPAEQIIRGRFIDIEGQPCGTVQFSVNSVGPRAVTGTRVRLRGALFAISAKPSASLAPQCDGQSRRAFCDPWNSRRSWSSSRHRRQ